MYEHLSWRTRPFSREINHAPKIFQRLVLNRGPNPGIASRREFLHGTTVVRFHAKRLLFVFDPDLARPYPNGRTNERTPEPAQNQMLMNLHREQWTQGLVMKRFEDHQTSNEKTVEVCACCRSA